MKKVLIANRGEIAVRIARACTDHGVASVAVYARADLDALHTRIAGEAWSLEGDSPAETYLDAAKLLAIAARAGVDAVHPGYGFLSESATFAQAVIDAGLTWIGPPPAAIAALGDKVEARRIALSVGAPLVPGTPGPVAGDAEVVAFAETHGLPIAIKAAFGGGGRGIKVVRRLDEIAGAYESAVREAITAFGRGECFVERFLDRPRHVEAQVLADTHGTVVVLGTRDCSLQRRNQKLVEEAPAPYLTDAQRERIHASARDICAAAGYVSAGTVEYLLGEDGSISFLEVNTRLQVEHPVTEETSGLDLVVEQLRIADGLPMSLAEVPLPRGHAIEFRINAEDVGRGFLPTPGTVTVFDAPSGPGVRVDSGIGPGCTVGGQFDSLMAKLIVTGATRAQALARARRALDEFRIEGIATVLPFHRAVVRHPDFVGDAGFKVHTRWIETDFANGEPPAPPAWPADSLLHRTAIEVDGRRVVLRLPMELLRGQAASAGGDAEQVGGPPVEMDDADAAKVKAPVAGTLARWKVADGATVAAGSVVAIMEAMKMEMEVVAERAGRVVFVATAGSQLTVGALLARIDN